MAKWKVEQQLTKDYNLRQCSMGRCCNAEKVDSLMRDNEELSRELNEVWSVLFGQYNSFDDFEKAKQRLLE